MTGHGRLLITNAAAVWLLLATIVGCGSDSPRKPGYPLQIVCTTGQVGDMLRHIGGEHVYVDVLMGPDVDPHLFEPAIDTQRSLHAADAVFYSGLHLEGRMSDVLERMAERKPTFAVTAGLLQSEPDKLLKPAGFDGAYDPHVWFDAALWSQCARYAGERLAEVDPGRASEYRKNADAYAADLLELDAWVRKQIERIPEDQRVLITAHDAFEYFGRAYGIEVHGLQGISTRDEADIKEVSRLVDLIVDRNVQAVFVESSVPERNVQTLIDNCATRGHAVKIGGKLYSDAIGPAGTPEGTYAGMLQYNVHTIVDALQ